MRRSIALSSAMVLALTACGGSADDGIATVDDVPTSNADEFTGADDDTTEDTVPSIDDPGETAPAPADAASATAPAISISPNANPDLVAVTTTPPQGANDPSGFDLDPDSAAVRGAVDDLADRLSIGGDAVTVLSARAVTWPDSSLGCPIPGMQYLQVLTDGTEVVLEAGGETYRYTGGTPLALCEQSVRPAEG